MHTFVVNIVIIHTWTRFFIGTFNMYTPWTHVHNLNTCTHYEHMATSWPHVNCTHDEHIYTPGTHGHALNTVIQSRHKKTSLFAKALIYKILYSWHSITIQKRTVLGQRKCSHKYDFHLICCECQLLNLPRCWMRQSRPNKIFLLWKLQLNILLRGGAHVTNNIHKCSKYHNISVAIYHWQYSCRELEHHLSYKAKISTPVEVQNLQL